MTAKDPGDSGDYMMLNDVVSIAGLHGAHRTFIAGMNDRMPPVLARARKQPDRARWPAKGREYRK